MDQQFLQAEFKKFSVIDGVNVENLKWVESPDSVYGELHPDFDLLQGQTIDLEGLEIRARTTTAKWHGWCYARNTLADGCEGVYLTREESNKMKRKVFICVFVVMGLVVCEMVAMAHEFYEFYQKVGYIPFISPWFLK